jgi:peptidoglycan hydrolase CwlO-like protein
MAFSLGDIISFASMVVSVLVLIIGLPTALYSARKQVAEAKNLLAQEAATYTQAARDAVEAQTSLQRQINELREQIESRDKLIEKLQEEISKRDTKILNLEHDIEVLQKAQVNKDAEIAILREEVEKLRRN